MNQGHAHTHADQNSFWLQRVVSQLGSRLRYPNRIVGVGYPRQGQFSSRTIMGKRGGDHPHGKVAKAKAKPKPLVLPPAVGDASINAAIQAKLADCDTTIKTQFTDLQAANPTASSGVAAYEKVACAKALSSGLPYVASCPFYWLDPNFELQPNVPKYQTRIDNLQEHFFSSPAYLDKPIEVFLREGEIPHKMIGSLKATDPPEMRDAFRQAIAAAINGTAKAKELAEWREILMSTVFKFVESWVSLESILVLEGMHEQTTAIKRLL